MRRESRKPQPGGLSDRVFYGGWATFLYSLSPCWAAIAARTARRIMPPSLIFRYFRHHKSYHEAVGKLRYYKCVYRLPRGNPLPGFGFDGIVFRIAPSVHYGFEQASERSRRQYFSPPDSMRVENFISRSYFRSKVFCFAQIHCFVALSAGVAFMIAVY